MGGITPWLDLGIKSEGPISPLTPSEAKRVRTKWTQAQPGMGSLKIPCSAPVAGLPPLSRQAGMPC